MGNRVLLVRHGDAPEDDHIATWARVAGFDLDVRRPFKGDTLGDASDDLVGSVIYGGMFNVFETDKHPFLKEEYRWVDACLAADIPLLGICQGAQQIAYRLGAWVGPREPAVHEFGCYRIDPTPEAAGFMDGPIWMPQAHFHTFDLPDGAVRLAGTETYENQAFLYGDKVYGTQFHPEVSFDGFRRWQEDVGDFSDMPGAQPVNQQTRLLKQHGAAQKAWLTGFLDKLIGRPE